MCSLFFNTFSLGKRLDLELLSGRGVNRFLEKGGRSAWNTAVTQGDENISYAVPV